MSWPEQEGLPPKYGMKWNPLKWSCLRNGVVWGSSLMHSPSLSSSMSMSSPLTRNVKWTNVDTRERSHAKSNCSLALDVLALTQVAVWWWWLLKRVKRAYVLCECQFWFSANTNTLFWWCPKRLKELDKSIIRVPKSLMTVSMRVVKYF